jgi:hypothetical protein
MNTFEKEVSTLGNSDRFMNLLAKRSNEKGVMSIEEFAGQLRSRRAGASNQTSENRTSPKSTNESQRRNNIVAEQFKQPGLFTNGIHSENPFTHFVI